MKLLEKVQNLPERKRKIIFWVVMILTAISLLIIYAQYISNKIKAIENEKLKDELQLHQLKDKLESI